MIPPEQDSDFAAAMEKVLGVYKRPYNSAFLVVCMDESPTQLIGETRIPIAQGKGRPYRYDCEYERCGVCNVFMANELLAGKRYVKITERKTKADRAFFMEEIASLYEKAERKFWSWMMTALMFPAPFTRRTHPKKQKVF